MNDRELPLLYDLLNTKLHQWLSGFGVSPEQMAWVGLIAGLTLVLLAMALLSKLLNWIVTLWLHRLAVTTVSELDDNLVKHRMPRFVARIIPLILAYNLVPAVLSDFPKWVPVGQGLFNIFFIVLATRILRSFLHASRDTLKDSETYRSKPLDSYAQVISLILWIIAGVLIFSQLTGRSALAFLTAMGAASAVLLLIFKDAILGFVASIQISANDMLRRGDWITMPKYGADGDVEEINLTTVKVINFDKTITMIPTYALISDSFQNWRGMQESGGRRIKRSILLKVSSIRFLSTTEIDALKKIKILAPFIEERSAEIAAFNEERGLDGSMPVNGRKMTNAGLYRKYIDLYLAQHPGINKHMTRMVRQHAPNEFGLPLELYCFTNTTEWVSYEGTMSDIFDHLLAAHTYFNIVVFERPAADDMRNMGKPLLSATN